MKRLFFFLLVACGGKASDVLDASIDASSSDASTIFDGRPMTKDASTSDVPPTPCSNGSSSCHPTDVSQFVPNWKPPTNAHQGKCTAQLIDDLWKDCLSPNATSMTCDKWYGMSSDMAHQQCVECIFTPETSPKLGPLYTFDSTEDINYAGCLVLLEPNELACAQAVQAAQQCGSASCLGNCPVNDVPGWQEFQKCVQLAQTACGCQKFQQAAQCANKLQGPGAKCFAGNDWHESYTFVANLFCGP